MSGNIEANQKVVPKPQDHVSWLLRGLGKRIFPQSDIPKSHRSPKTSPVCSRVEITPFVLISFSPCYRKTKVIYGHPGLFLWVFCERMTKGANMLPEFDISWLEIISKLCYDLTVVCNMK